MIVARLELWKSERVTRPVPPPSGSMPDGHQKHVVEIECVHCHSRFFRWTATASAYGRCEHCSTDH
jgi:hypothetical protein